MWSELCASSFSCNIFPSSKIIMCADCKLPCSPGIRPIPSGKERQSLSEQAADFIHCGEVTTWFTLKTIRCSSSSINTWYKTRAVCVATTRRHDKHPSILKTIWYKYLDLDMIQKQVAMVIEGRVINHSSHKRVLSKNHRTQCEKGRGSSDYLGCYAS